MNIEQILQSELLFNSDLVNPISNVNTVGKKINFKSQVGTASFFSASPVAYKTYDMSSIPLGDSLISVVFQRGTDFSTINSEFIFSSLGTWSGGLLHNKTTGNFDFQMPFKTISIPVSNDRETHQIILTLNNTASTWNMYLDGAILATESQTTSEYFDSSVIFGATYDVDYERAFNGSLIDFSIFNFSNLLAAGLTESQIVDSLYNNKFNNGRFKFVSEYSPEVVEDTSGDSIYTFNTNDICEQALKKVGATTFGNSPRPEDLESAKRELNVMVKNWRADNVFIWKTKWLVIPVSQSDYVIASDGNCYECIRHNIASVGNQPISGAQYLSFWLKRYSKWVVNTSYSIGTVIVGSDSNLYSCVTSNVSTTNDDPVTGGNYLVYWTKFTSVLPSTWLVGTEYNSICNIQLTSEILGANQRIIGFGAGFLRNGQGQDSFLNTHLQAYEYFRMGNKTNLGKPTMLYFKRNKTVDEFFAYPYPDNSLYEINLEVYFYPENFNDATDDADFLDEWIAPLVDGLAVRLYSLYPGRGRVTKDELLADFNDSYGRARGGDGEKGDVQFAPDFFSRGGRY